MSYNIIPSFGPPHKNRHNFPSSQYVCVCRCRKFWKIIELNFLAFTTTALSAVWSSVVVEKIFLSSSIFFFGQKCIIILKNPTKAKIEWNCLLGILLLSWFFICYYFEFFALSWEKNVHFIIDNNLIIWYKKHPLNFVCYNDRHKIMFFFFQIIKQKNVQK